MLLAIDIGNTNTVFALFKGRDVVHSWRCKSEKSRSADEYAVFLSQMFGLINRPLDLVSAVIVSSVVPDANFHIAQFCRKYLSCEALFVDAGKVDLQIDLDQPEEIGADRIVNAVAVMAYYSAPAIVIDFGTATTFDVIDEGGLHCGGVYRGGVIAPGIRLSIEALTTRAAKLPQISIENPGKVIGRNTRAAMKSGMYWGYIGLIEGIVSKIKDEMGKDMQVIATGGLAPLYSQSTDVIDYVDDELIFKGLLEIYQVQQNKEETGDL